MNILIVEARYHPTVTDTLVDGATAALEKGGARFSRVAVPGVLELPAAIAIASQAAKPFDGYVALGSVVGPLAEMLYAQTVQALMALGTRGLALGNGIVLAGDEGSAHDLAARQDIGGDAARACLSLVTLAQRTDLL
jgi:6,7-dimethyl-8-ribityllumazine synthase